MIMVMGIMVMVQYLVPNASGGPLLLLHSAFDPWAQQRRQSRMLSLCCQNSASFPLLPACWYLRASHLRSDRIADRRKCRAGCALCLQIVRESTVSGYNCSCYILVPS